MQTKFKHRWLLVTPLVQLLTGCGAGAEMAMDSGYWSGAMDDADGGGDGGADGGAGDDWEPEEPEAPPLPPLSSSSTYVFVANPDRNTITRIEANSLAVITAPVGSRPTQIRVSPDDALVYVFNEDSDDVHILGAESLEGEVVELRPNLNQITLSPDGAWLAAWHNGTQEDTSSGATSYNEVSLVRNSSREHFPLVVGYNPRQVLFTADGRSLVVVSDSYLVLVDLTVDEPEPIRIRISEDTLAPPAAEEVVLTPDSRYAIIRQFGATELVVVELDTQAVGQIAVGDNPTDIDVTPDGTQAIAVARGSNELWIYDLTDPFQEPQVIAMPLEVPVGSVLLTPDNRQGLLYSTASGVAAFATWDRLALPGEEVGLFSLIKPIAGVEGSPDGRAAIIRHNRDENGDLPSSSPFYNEHALTLLSLQDYFTNAIRLPGAPLGSSALDSGDLGFMTLANMPLLLQFNFDSLIHEEIELKSNAEDLGVLPGRPTVYVSQTHDLGRISFYDTDSGEVQTITGFELNAAIEH